MEQLVKLVTQQTGISEDKARVAVQTVVAFLKERLPGGLGGQIDSLLAGGTSGAADLGGLAGGLLGRDKR